MMMQGTVFDIQTYAIHDGPGIRTCVYFKGCPLRCYWCHNPESQSFAPEMACRAGRCAGCRDCVAACPHGALRAERNAVVRDNRLCRRCGACADVCPEDAMQTIGYRIAADELVRRAIRDKEFFDNSAGGVTLTGGEPTAQAGFLLEVLAGLRREGIHTVLETCGHFPEHLVDPLAGLVDLFLFDLKHICPEAHRRGTGRGNRRILANYRSLLARVGQDRITPRIPVVPGFNTDRRTVESLAAFLKETGRRAPVDLMPYHGLGRHKYQTTGRVEPRRVERGPNPEERAWIGSVFDSCDLAPIWN